MTRLILCLCFAAAAIGAAAPAAEPPPVLIARGVSIGSVSVGGLHSEAARTTLRRVFGRPLRFDFGEKRWSATPEELGARAAVDQAVSRALLARPRAKLPLRVVVDPRPVERFVGKLDRTVSYGATNTKLAGLVALAPSFTAPKPGLKLEREKLATSITRALERGFRGTFSLPTRRIEPTLTPDEYGPVIVIRRGSNALTLYDGPTLTNQFRVATGRAQFPTPEGQFSIVDMQRNPWWRPPTSDWAKGLKPIPPGPGNPLGTRWMGLSVPAVGIHGTPDAASIGYSASHGCIRMKISDAEWLFDHVEVGTPVFIVSA